MESKNTRCPELRTDACEMLVPGLIHSMRLASYRCGLTQPDPHSEPALSYGPDGGLAHRTLCDSTRHTECCRLSLTGGKPAPRPETAPDAVSPEIAPNAHLLRSRAVRQHAARLRLDAARILEHARRLSSETARLCRPGTPGCVPA